MFGVVLYFLFHAFGTAQGGVYNGTAYLPPKYRIHKLCRRQRAPEQRQTCWPAAELAVTSSGLRLYVHRCVCAAGVIRFSPWSSK